MVAPPPVKVADIPGHTVCEFAVTVGIGFTVILPVPVLLQPNVVPVTV